MSKFNDFNIKIFLDGIKDFDEIFYNSAISGYTTNPSLMKSAGVTDYESYIKEVVSKTSLPVSFEVLADEPGEIVRQAKKISSYSDSIYVKVPICYTNGTSTFREIEYLSKEGIPLNVTAIMHPEQCMVIEPVLDEETPIIISYFAGRVADTGIDPVFKADELTWIFEEKPNAELLWASCRETLNICQAESANFDIITCPEAIIKKLDIVDKNLMVYSRETVTQFYNDAQSAGYTI
jgi:transaldolase